MGDAVELVADGLVDLRPAMAVEIGPDGGIAIEVFAAVLGLQHRAAALDDDDGPVGRAFQSRICVNGCQT